MSFADSRSTIITGSCIMYAVAWPPPFWRTHMGSCTDSTFFDSAASAFTHLYLAVKSAFPPMYCFPLTRIVAFSYGARTSARKRSTEPKRFAMTASNASLAY